MNAIKPANAVVAVADLLSATVAEYEQRVGEQQRALEAMAQQLKQLNDERVKAHRVLEEMALLAVGSDIEKECSSVLAQSPWPIAKPNP